MRSMAHAIRAADPNPLRPGEADRGRASAVGGLAVVLLGVALAAGPALAQDVIRPTAEIRVLEAEDPLHGRYVREVVPDPTPAEILRVQVALARAGHDPGVRSGVLDAPTRSALRRLQIERGLGICGCVSYETVVALGIRVEVVAPGAHAARGYGSSTPRVVIIELDGPRGVVVKGGGGGVVVGHDPAVGAGGKPRRRGDDGRPRSSVGVREPIPPPPARGTPSRIQPGR